MAKAPNPVTEPTATEFAVARAPRPDTSLAEILRPDAVIDTLPVAPLTL